ncbi:MAG: L-arabinose isomerase, partial [Muribaculaceae bacterium]|nr:L-arabinose isomerase [Muribaculaceae bacterium]
MNAFDNLEVWWVTGAQLLYGGDAVVAVDAHSKEMVDGLNNSGRLPIKVVYKGTANSSKEVEAIMSAASNDNKCVGIITWMHTFSPAKMWIHGLQKLTKPLLHLHTQYNAEIPWDTMDMDFMNLNQSAHGDREFGHICARMRVRRKVVVGYWKDEATQDKIAVWSRVAAGWADAQDMLILRFGDQMNNVAVTDGDKVEAEVRLGYHVDYTPVSELMEHYKKVSDDQVKELMKEYFASYSYDPELAKEGTEGYKAVFEAAKAELALRSILTQKGAKGFTTNFDDLGTKDINDPHFVGFNQIPGLASQRLMAEGYGFGAEGDWKSAALYRTVWYMTQGLPTGCSFLEDYTLNFDGKNSSILQAHMLEVCPLIAEEKPRLEVHFLGIGVRKAQTARLVFTSKPGKGVTATVIDLGNRFRLIVNDVECIKSKPLPKLPVASALWIPMPNFEICAGEWI